MNGELDEWLSSNRKAFSTFSRFDILLGPILYTSLRQVFYSFQAMRLRSALLTIESDYFHKKPFDGTRVVFVQ